jgi:hypothetical protein
MHRISLFLPRLLIILNLMFLIQSHSSQAATPENRVALVIGNSAYQNAPPLANPRNDAMEIGKALKRIGFDVDVVLDATKTEMDQALRRFGNKLEGASAAVFFYAGHGIQVDGLNYILPVNTALKNERDLHWDSCDLTTVLKQMEGNNRVNLLFLDACRDNPLSQTLARGMGESRSSAIGRGLAPMKATAGTLISYSTKEGEVAADGKGKHSPYTEALLKHIQTPGVEIGLMLRKVRQEVISSTNNKQVPWEYGSLLGEFYFSGPVTIQVQPEADKSPSGSKIEALYWESIMSETDPDVFEDYLIKYPGGAFREIAKRKIEKLNKSGTKPSTAKVVPQSDQTKPSVVNDTPQSDQTKPSVANDTPRSDQTKPSVVDYVPRSDRTKPSAVNDVTQSDQTKPSIVDVIPQSDQTKPSGKLKITSNPPGADIYLDEKYMGITPAELVDVPAGTYTLVLKMEEFDEWTDTVTVKAGKTVSINDGSKPLVTE